MEQGKGVGMPIIGPTIMGPATLKGFGEITEKEQIQRLREELMNIRYMINRIVRLEDKVKKLEIHQHGANGEVLVSVLCSENNFVANGSYDKLK